MAALRRVVDSPAVSVFRADVPSLLIAVFRDAVTIPQANEFRAALVHATDESEGGLGVLVVVAEDVSPPSSEVRKELSETMAVLQHNAAGLACVVQGSGVVQAAKRTISSVIFAVAGVRVPSKVFSSLDEATAWLANKMGPDVGQGLVGGVAEEAMAAMNSDVG